MSLMLGNPGQPMIARPLPDTDENGVETSGQAAATAMPSPCLRNLNSFRPECPRDCPGRQRDDGCLADLVRDAHQQGCTVKFEIDPRDGVWDPL